MNTVDENNIISWIQFIRLNITASQINKSDVDINLNVFKATYAHLIEKLQNDIMQAVKIEKFEELYSSINAIEEHDKLVPKLIEKFVQLIFSANNMSHVLHEYPKCEYVNFLISTMQVIFRETLTEERAKQLLNNLQNKPKEVYLLIVNIEKELKTFISQLEVDINRIKLNIALLEKLLPNNRNDTEENIQNFQMKMISYKNLISEKKHSFETLIYTFNELLSTFKFEIEGIKDSSITEESKKLYGDAQELEKLYEEIYSLGKNTKQEMSGLKQLKDSLEYLRMALDQGNHGRFQSPRETIQVNKSAFFTDLEAVVTLIKGSNKIDMDVVNKLRFSKNSGTN